MKKLLSLLLLTFLLFSSAFSQDKVMKMIQNGDYDKAFDALIKKYQKSPEDVATNYMLSRLYSSSGFKSYDAEIAYDHLCTAKKGYTACDQSDKDKLMDIPLNDNILNDATADINKKGFDALVKYKDPEKCNKYLEKHTDAGDLLRQAKQLRDKYALEQAEKKNTPEAYMEAMKKYPDASNFQLLKIRFDKLMFDKETSAGTLACYVDYLRNNPGTGFREIAEDKIFQLAVPNKTLDEYMLFVSKFPENKNTGEAYNAIYKSVNWDDGEYGTIQKFFMQYPDFPRDHKGLSSDIALAELAWELGLTERIAVSPFGNLSQKQATNDELNRRLQNAGAKTGEIQISLMWNGYNDIDLYCEEPSGESVWFRHRKSASGGELDVDMNAAYGGRFLDLEDQGGDKNEAYKALYDSVRQPVIQEGVKYYEKRTSSSPCENIYWPKGNIPSGKYKIYVSFFNDYKYDPKCGGHTVEDCPDAVEYSVRLRIGNEYRDFTGVVEWDEKREKVLIYEFYYFAPGINTKPVVNEAEKLDYFIKNAAHKELAYIALQRKIKPFVAARNWKKAEEILTISREYFKTSKERYDKISQLLAIVKTGKEGAKPENLGTAINTKAEEYAPVISANNRLLFFCGRDRTDNLGKEDIFSSIATYSPPTISAAGDTIYDTTGTWSKATIFPYINTKTGNEAPLSVSVDGNTLLLFSGGDIYFVVRTTEGWSEQKKFPNPINTEYWEGDAMLTADGKAILFASNRPGGYNLNTEQGFYHGDYTYASDLYVSVKNGDSWGEPINLGPKINTMYCERSPFLHPDMKTLYFSSDGHYGFGQLDVFKTTMNTEGDYTSWAEPQNLGKSVNTGGPDWGYNISTFGIYAYFAAQNKENKDDIYRVLLPEDMRPKAVVAVSGKVTDTDGKPLDAKLLWENLELNQAIGQLSSDPVTGNYFIVLPAGKLYGYYADKSGYYPVSKSIDLRNVNQYREITEDIVLVSLEEMKKLKTAVRINNIFFDLDKWDLRPESYPELDRLVEILKKIIANDPTMKIEIMGHTDNTGSDTHNQTLSENRAKAVYTYILSKGIAEKHLTFNGYGEKKPVSDNNTESGRQKNRRVEFRFTE